MTTIPPRDLRGWAAMGAIPGLLFGGLLLCAALACCYLRWRRGAEATLAAARWCRS